MHPPKSGINYFHPFNSRIGKSKYLNLPELLENVRYSVTLEPLIAGVFSQLLGQQCSMVIDPYLLRRD